MRRTVPALLLTLFLAAGLAACDAQPAPSETPESPMQDPASPDPASSDPASPDPASSEAEVPAAGDPQAESETRTEEGAEKELSLATFGGGCFWCVEAVFLRLKGVHKAVSGFSGGHVEDPDYKEVITGRTGHAEVVQIHFDPDVISYADLLEVFFEVHDPTTLNRQGNDVGTQYRSIILFHDDAQRVAAEKHLQSLADAGRFEASVVTQLQAYERFHPAEDYHQDYFDNNPNQGYCRVVISPKVEKFEKAFADRLK